MRQITAQTAHAVEQKKNMSKGNMAVFYKKDTYFDLTAGRNLSLVYLHGNLIAAFNHRESNLYIRSAGWQSNTTKERLNGLLNYFGYNLGIYQKDWNWYIRTDNGDVAFHEAFNAEVEVDPNSYHKIKFINCNKLNK